MILSIAIVSKRGDVFIPNRLPMEVKSDISHHAENFLKCLVEETEEIEIPYIEKKELRYIFKETGDLYWVVVTRPESDMFLDIDILGRFVCTLMEYGLTPETNSDTLSDEQQKLYYSHVWRPWDDLDQCPLCNQLCNSEKIWETEFEARLQFLISIRDGHVDDTDSNYFSGLIFEAWSASVKLNPNWSNAFKSERSSSDGSDLESICEEVLLDNCRLKCRLEDIRLEITRLQDPYLRIFARRDLLNDSYIFHYGPQTSAPNIKEMDSETQSTSELSFSNYSLFKN